MPVIVLIIISALINTTAQLLLKAGANHLKLSAQTTVWHYLLQLMVNPYLMIGGVCYVASVCVWVLILSRVPVSFAYPLGSIAYITTAIAATIIFHQYLSFTRIMGILIIIFGVYLISRTA